jgi:hypothetical protein
MVLNEIDYVRRSRVDVSDLCFDATVRDAAVGFDDARGDRREREREREVRRDRVVGIVGIVGCGTAS